MQRLLFTCFAIVFVFFAHAQNKKLDSLNNALAKAASDTARINLLNAKANTLTEINLDSSILIAKSVVEKAKQVNYLKGEATAYRVAGTAFTYKGDFKLAAENYKAAEQLYRQSADSEGLNKVYRGYGMYYGMQSKYDSSIIFFKKVVDFTERNANKKDLSSAYQNLAVSYTMQSNYNQALYYQNKALRLAESMNDTTNMAYINLNMAIGYSNVYDYARSEALLRKAIMYAQHAQIKNVELYGYANLASTCNKLKRYTESYSYAMKAATLGKQLGDNAIVASSLARGAEALANQNQFASAEKLGLEAVAIADTAGSPMNVFQTNTSMGFIKKQQAQFPSAMSYYEKGFAALKDADLYDEQIASAYGDLADVYEHTGLYQKALSTFKMATKISDSIHSRENIRKATELSMNYDFAKKEQAQRLLKEKEDNTNKIKLIFLIAVLLVFITLSTVTLVAYKRAQRAKTLLSLQKKQVEQALSKLKLTQTQLVQTEKMASLGELTAGIAHEIQNPLNFVNNFSEVSSELLDEMQTELYAGNKEEAVAIAGDVKQNLSKIIFHGKRADSIVKNMLLHSRKSTGQKEPTEINALTDEYLRLSYHGLRAKDKTFNAAIHTSFDLAIGNIPIVPQDIGRVILNLLNNAFYAVNTKQKKLRALEPPVDYEPMVSVTTKKINTSYIEIRIKDNGSGITADNVNKIFQPFFTTKPTGEGTGLGLSLSYDIITKGHGGSLNVQSQEGEYTEFVITLPV